MTTTITAEQPRPRASEATARRRILAEISDAEDRLRRAESRSEMTADPSYSRAAYRAREDLAKQQAALAAFDAKEKRRAEMAESRDADKARKHFAKSLKAWETALAEFAALSSGMLDAAQDYAEKSGEKDSGRFPHRHVVLTAITMRAHGELARAGLKFQKHPPSNPQASLVQRWAV